MVCVEPLSTRASPGIQGRADIQVGGAHSNSICLQLFWRVLRVNGREK
jgi:hypothetical protein